MCINVVRVIVDLRGARLASNRITRDVQAMPRTARLRDHSAHHHAHRRSRLGLNDARRSCGPRTFVSVRPGACSQATRCGWTRYPPFAITLPACANCTEVTAISCPIGTDPIDVGCQRLRAAAGLGLPPAARFQYDDRIRSVGCSRTDSRCPLACRFESRRHCLKTPAHPQSTMPDMVCDHERCGRKRLSSRCRN